MKILSKEEKKKISRCEPATFDLNRYPVADEMSDIYQTYLTGIVSQVTDDNSSWRSASRTESLATAMIKLYEQVHV
jgi:hypothetical protein